MWFGFLPIFVRYVNSLPGGDVPGFGKWQAIGRQSKWFALVLKGRESDTGIVVHEATHVMHWYLCFFVTLALWVLLGALLTVDIGWTADAPAHAVMSLEDAALILTAPALLTSIYMHGLLYRTVRAYRRWTEVGAFAVQSKAYVEDNSPEKVQARMELFASFLTLPVYDLQITAIEAYELIRERLR